MYRQGDVLLMPIKTLPGGLVPVPRDLERGTVLAYGEATGHAHAIPSDFTERACLFPPDEGSGHSLGHDSYLTITGTKPVSLRHDEHEEIGLLPGHYRVVRQQEYAPGAVRRYVAD